MALALIIGFGAGFGVAKAFYGGSSTVETPVVAQRSGDSSEPSTPPSSPLAQFSIYGWPYSGRDDAPVTFVEFIDYECPFCGRHFRQTLPTILSEYKGQIKYVILSYPISTIHPYAQKASEAAECAYDQGQFWDCHDAMFQNQEALDTDSLKQYAIDLGLDSGAFDTCLGSGAKVEQMRADFQVGVDQVGVDQGVTGTPTFFVIGARLVGARPFRSFQTAIDETLRR